MKFKFSIITGVTLFFSISIFGQDLGTMKVVPESLLDMDGFYKAKEIDFDMGPDLKNLKFVMYKKDEKNSESALTVMIIRGKDILYAYQDNQFCWENDEVEFRDVTNDGIPEVLFESRRRESGTAGDPSRWHVITLLTFDHWNQGRQSGLEDVAPYNLHKPVWITVNGKIYAISSYEKLSFNFDPFSPDRNCTPCPAYWQIVAYLWDPACENFVITNGIKSSKEERFMFEVSPQDVERIKNVIP